jgi:hypothetical protein
LRVTGVCPAFEKHPRAHHVAIHQPRLALDKEGAGQIFHVVFA